MGALQPSAWLRLGPPGFRLANQGLIYNRSAVCRWGVHCIPSHPYRVAITSKTPFTPPGAVHRQAAGRNTDKRLTSARPY
jgi:hypothetical protein